MVAGDLNIEILYHRIVFLFFYFLLDDTLYFISRLYVLPISAMEYVPSYVLDMYRTSSESYV